MDKKIDGMFPTRCSMATVVFEKLSALVHVTACAAGAGRGSQ